MRPFEDFSTLWPKDLHQEEDKIRDVTLDKLINEARPVRLIQDWVNLIRLRAHILEDIIHSIRV